MLCSVFGSLGDDGYVGEAIKEWPALEKSLESQKLIKFWSAPFLFKAFAPTLYELSAKPGIM